MSSNAVNIDEDVEIMELLIQSNSFKELEAELKVNPHNVSVTDMYGDYPIIWAASGGQVVNVIVLLAYGANINASNIYSGNTPLIVSAEAGKDEVVKLLIERGADISLVRKDNDSSLHVACEKGHIRIAQMLIDHGASIDALGHNGNTPLIVSCSKGHYKIFQLLIDCGANINIKNDDGHSALHVACIENRIDCVRALLSKGAYLDDVDKNNETALHLACMHGFLDIALTLIDKCASIQMRTNDGSTQLHLACSSGKTPVALMLINKGCSVHDKNNNGYTALHCACISGDEHLVMTLLDHGASIDEVDHRGRKALDVSNDSYIKNCVLSYFLQRNIVSENHIHEVEFKLDTLDNELIKTKSISTARITQLEALLAEQQRITSGLSSQVDGITDIKIEYNQTKTHLMELIVSVQELKNENTFLQLKVDGYANDNNILNNSLTEIKKTSRDNELTFNEDIRLVRSQSKQFQELFEKKCVRETELIADVSQYKSEIEAYVLETSQLKALNRDKELAHATEIRALQSQYRQLQELKDQKTSTEMELLSCRKEIDDLIEQVETLKNSYQKKELSYHEEVRSNQTYQKCNKELKDRIDMLGMELTASKTEYAIANEELMSSRNTLRDKVVRANEDARTIQMQLRQIQELRDQVSHNKTEASALKKEVVSLQEEMTVMHTSHQIQTLNLTEDVDALRLLSKQYKHDTVDLTAQLEVLKLKLDSCDTKNLQLVSQLSIVSDAKHQECQSNHVIINQLQVSLDAALQAYNELTSRSNDAELQHSQDRYSYEETIKEINSSIDKLHHQVEAHALEIEQLGRKNKTYIDELKVANRSVANAEKSLASMTTAHSDAVEENEVLKTSINDMSTINATLVDKVTHLEAKVSTLTSINLQSQDELCIVKLSLQDVVNQLKATDQRLATCKKVAASNEKTITDMHAKKEECRSVIEQLKSSVEEGRLREAAMQLTIDGKTSMIDTLTDKLNRTERQVSVLMSDKEVLQHKLSACMSHISEVEEISGNHAVHVKTLSRKIEGLEVEVLHSKDSIAALKNDKKTLRHELDVLKDETSVILNTNREATEKHVCEVRSSVIDDLHILELQLANERKLLQRIHTVREAEKELIDKAKKHNRTILLDLLAGSHIGNDDSDSKYAIHTPNSKSPSSTVRLDDSINTVESESMYTLSKEIMKVSTVVNSLRSKSIYLWKIASSHLSKATVCKPVGHHLLDIEYLHTADDASSVDGSDAAFSKYSLLDILVDVSKLIDITNQHNHDRLQCETDGRSRSETSLDEVRHQLEQLHMRHEALKASKVSDDQKTSHDVVIMKEELLKYKKEYVQVNSEYITTKAALNAASECSTRLSHQLSVQTDINAKQAEEIRTISSKLSKALTVFEEKEKHMNEAISGLKADNHKALNDISTLTAAVNDVSKMNALQQEYDKAHQHLIVVTETYEKLQLEYKTNVIRYDTLSSRYTEVNAAYEIVKSEYKKLESRLGNEITARLECERMLKKFGDGMYFNSNGGISTSVEGSISDSSKGNGSSSVLKKMEDINSREKFVNSISQIQLSPAVASPVANFSVKSPFKNDFIDKLSFDMDSKINESL